MPFKTALVAAPLLLLVAGLGMRISIRRRRERIGPGMPGDATFTRLQRAHANAVEHVPVLLLGLLLLEFLRASPWQLVIFGATIVIARFAHAAGIVQRPRHPLHTLGAALTYTLEVAMAFAKPEATAPSQSAQHAQTQAARLSRAMRQVASERP